MENIQNLDCAIDRIRPYQGKMPEIGDRVFIAPGAHVVGSVVLGKNSSVFYNTVVRGDVNEIVIGEQTNIQDNCTLHVSINCRLAVGNLVTVGHNAILHGCTIGDNVVIGMGSIVLDRATIGEDSIVAAGSLVPPGKQFAPGSLIMGSPAKIVRPLTVDEINNNRAIAARYVGVKDNHRDGQAEL